MQDSFSYSSYSKLKTESYIKRNVAFTLEQDKKKLLKLIL